MTTVIRQNPWHNQAREFTTFRGGRTHTRSRVTRAHASLNDGSVSRGRWSVPTVSRVQFVRGNWKLFGNTSDRLPPVNSFIHHHGRPYRALSCYPSFFLPRFVRARARGLCQRGVLAGSGRPINPIHHGSSSARAAVLQFMNLLWAPPRVPRGLSYWFIVTFRWPRTGSVSPDVRSWRENWACPRTHFVPYFRTVCRILIATA